MKRLKLKIGKVYEVTWNDAYGIQSWKHIEDHRAHGAWECVTIGIYIGKNRAGDLLFASDTDKQGMVAGVQSRPAKMVVKIKRLT